MGFGPELKMIYKLINQKLNMQKNYTRFYTPEHTINEMFQMIDFNFGNSVLEPHAGRGNIIEAVREFSQVPISYCEHEAHRAYKVQLKHPHIEFLGRDFLHASTYNKFDCVIANPPFNDEEDIGLHFIKMFYSLNIGGTLITIMPKQIGSFTPLIDPIHDILEHRKYEFRDIENWATNSDGSKTELVLLKIKR